MARRPYGPSAWLIDELTSPAAWAAGLTARADPGIIEIVPAESTVVVRCERDRHETIGTVLDEIVPAEAAPAADDLLIIDAIYDGEDLHELADSLDLGVDQLIEIHTAMNYDVAFCGFSPGFGYLRGLDERLHVPRRPNPRLSVPRGSIGVAAGYTCVYPSASPGGWHLIGRTDTAVWDLDAEPPALFRPGRRVRFRRVEP